MWVGFGKLAIVVGRVIGESPEKYQWTLENIQVCAFCFHVCTASDECLYGSRTHNSSTLFMTESHFPFYLFFLKIKLYLFSLLLNMQIRLVSWLEVNVIVHGGAYFVDVNILSRTGDWKENSEVNGKKQKKCCLVYKQFPLRQIVGIFLLNWTFPALNIEQKLCWSGYREQRKDFNNWCYKVVILLSLSMWCSCERRCLLLLMDNSDVLKYTWVYHGI